MRCPYLRVSLENTYTTPVLVPRAMYRCDTERQLYWKYNKSDVKHWNTHICRWVSPPMQVSAPQKINYQALMISIRQQIADTLEVSVSHHPQMEVMEVLVYPTSKEEKRKCICLYFALFVIICIVNSLRSNDTIWWHRSGSTMVQVMACCLMIPEAVLTYRQVSNIRCTLEGNEIVDHSDVVGASPVGAAPTTSSLST